MDHLKTLIQFGDINDLMMNCPVCNTPMSIAASFQSSPYGDSFCDTSVKAINLRKYPIDVLHCPNCFLLTLANQYSPKSTADNFIYLTSITKPLLRRYESLANSLVKRFKPQKVLDIGSNDGTFLYEFLKLGVHSVLGVEPAEIPRNVAKSKGITSLDCFFDEPTVLNLKKDYDSFDIISMNYVFANMHEIESALHNIKVIMNHNTRIVVTTGYHPLQFLNGLVDYIYHEHYHYFCVKTMSYLCNKLGLCIESIEEIDDKGSSIIYTICKSSRSRTAREVLDRIQMEELAAWGNPETVNRFVQDYIDMVKRIKEYTAKLKSNGYIIIGFGASLSTSIFLHENQMGSLLDFIIDDNSAKHKLFSPGFGLEVLNPNSININKKCAIILLAWQHKESIYSRYRNLFQDALWIFPQDFWSQPLT